MIGGLTSDCYDKFEEAFRETLIELLTGQRPHVLRHSFASRFMMNDNNILVQRRILASYRHQDDDALQPVITDDNVRVKARPV